MSNLNRVYTDTFKVTFTLGDTWICTSQGEWACCDTSVHSSFLQAHNIKKDDKFDAEVDGRGNILLETIKKL